MKLLQNQKYAYMEEESLKKVVNELNLKWNRQLVKITNDKMVKYVDKSTKHEIFFKTHEIFSHTIESTSDDDFVNAAINGIDLYLLDNDSDGLLECYIESVILENYRIKIYGLVITENMLNLVHISNN